jgi:hypothetical protein
MKTFNIYLEMDGKEEISTFSMLEAPNRNSFILNIGNEGRFPSLSMYFKDLQSLTNFKNSSLQAYESLLRNKKNA